VTTAHDPLLVRPRKQSAVGAVLLVVGCALAVLIVEAGLNVLAGVGLVIAVCGIVLIVNGMLLERRQHAAPPPGQDGRLDRVSVLALVLAVLVPPVGLLLAAYRPPAGRHGEGLYVAAIAAGVALTVVYTMLAVMGAGLSRDGG
jgi:hypothetical protein